MTIYSVSFGKWIWAGAEDISGTLLWFIWAKLYKRSNETQVPPSTPSWHWLSFEILPISLGYSELLSPATDCSSCREALLTALLSPCEASIFRSSSAEYLKRKSLTNSHEGVTYQLLHGTFFWSVCIFKMTAVTEQCLDQKERSTNCGIKDNTPRGWRRF